jgi:hypothetical protein
MQTFEDFRFSAAFDQYVLLQADLRGDFRKLLALIDHVQTPRLAGGVRSANPGYMFTRTFCCGESHTQPREARSIIRMVQ